MLNAVLWGTLGGLIAGLATVIGATPSLFTTKRGLSISAHMSIEFALGMMLAASAFSLILPASQEAVVRGSNSLLLVALAIAFGGFFIWSLGRVGEHFRPAGITSTSANNGAWLFIVAMMLHNLPEGLASGAALAGLDPHQAFPILGAIALQNLPEGLTTAVAFKALGAPTRLAFLGAVASGAVEFFGGTLGGLLLGWVNQTLPYLLAFAGGAMILVASQEAFERLTSLATHMRTRALRDLSLGAVFMYAMSTIVG